MRIWAAPRQVPFRAADTATIRNGNTVTITNTPISVGGVLISNGVLQFTGGAKALTIGTTLPPTAGVPEKATARALVKPGEAYAVYLHGGKQAKLILELPAGRYAVEWINTKSGQIDKSGVERLLGASA